MIPTLSHLITVRTTTTLVAGGRGLFYAKQFENDGLLHAIKRHE